MGEIDRYLREDPFEIWSRMSSDVSGLAPRFPHQPELSYTFWESVKCNLELHGVPQSLSGRRIIELASGQRELFRNLCVESGAAEYIGVDPAAEPSQQLIQETKVRYVAEDAIRFLRKEPANSAIVASFMLLCDEMLEKRACQRYGIQPKAIWKELLAQIYRVSYEGLRSICAGSFDRESSIIYPLIEEVGFVRTGCIMLLLKPARTVA